MNWHLHRGQSLSQITTSTQPRFSARDDCFIDTSGRQRRLYGTCIYTGSSRLAELAGRVGYDTVWIEMEHGPADFAQVEQLCMATEAGGALPVVRVPDGQRMHVLRALEVGARIVVVPMVDNAEEARQVVSFGKFPPFGRRGYNSRSRGVGYGEGSVRDMFRDANDRTHLFAQIETRQAVENLDSILAVEGLSGIFLGPGDLSVDFGCIGELNTTTLIERIVDCIHRARAAKRHVGILVAPGLMLDAAIAAGADLLFFAGDISDLTPIWAQHLADARSAASAAVANDSQ